MNKLDALPVGVESSGTMLFSSRRHCASWLGFLGLWLSLAALPVRGDALSLVSAIRAHSGSRVVAGGATNPAALHLDFQWRGDRCRVRLKNSGRTAARVQEVVLLEQAFVMDGKTKVSKVVEDTAKQVGGPVRVAGFLRFALGEGIEKKSEDFAAEVAAQLKK